MMVGIIIQIIYSSQTLIVFIYFFQSFFLLAFLLLNFLDQDRELRIGVLGQLLGVAVLYALSFVEDHNFVTADDRVDPVSNCNHGSVFEGFGHELLNLRFSDDVNAGSCFIQENNLVVSEDSPADADELLLA